jgi:hypothetical protein
MAFLKFIKKTIFLLLFCGICYILYSYAFFYFDPLNMCKIRVEKDVSADNDNAIKKALELIKNQDRKAYGTICGYVDTISEKHCFKTDGHVNQAAYAKDWENAGCYVDGSKSIYLIPNGDSSADSIEQRAEAIKKYSEMSKNFWENIKK